MSYRISQHGWTTIHNMHAQLKLVASLASQSSANDMQELGVFLEVMAADAAYVLELDAQPIHDPAPVDTTQTAHERIRPRKRQRLVEGASA